MSGQNEKIELISELAPANGNQFAIGDVNDLRGGYIQTNTVQEMQSYSINNKAREGSLCYVVDDANHFYIFQSGAWRYWVIEGGGGSGTGVVVVELVADLNNPELKKPGQLVFINEIKEIRYYNGTVWESFSKIYIQETPPEDTGGIWIDTRTPRDYSNSDQVIQDLVKGLALLQERTFKLEYALNCNLDFGDFTNNKFYEYEDYPAVKPDYGNTEETDLQIQKDYLASGIVMDQEPTEYKDKFFTGVHLCFKSGTVAEMRANADGFLGKEFLYTWDTNELWVKNPKTGKIVKIGSGTTDPEIPTEEMEGILTEVIGTGSNMKTKIVGIEFADMSNKNLDYTLRVKDGGLILRDKRLDQRSLLANDQTVGTQPGYYSTLYFPISKDLTGTNDVSPKIYINMVYCGGEGDKYSFNPCSHNFVELSNLCTVDINLKGLYLHYTEGLTGKWVTLPLTGIIKAHSTFLIKGAVSAFENINTTLIKVGEPDLIWDKRSTLYPLSLEIEENPENQVVAHSIWDENGHIKFAENCAFYISSEKDGDGFDKTQLITNAPYKNKEVMMWYVDLLGLGTNEMPNEATAYNTGIGSDYLVLRYFTMDNVTQATKALSARKNSTDFWSINLKDVPKGIDITQYTPKNSKQGKNVFFNKTLLEEGAPNVVTCTFGYNANTTRCFNWVSVGYYDEFIKIWKEGETEEQAQIFESFKKEDLNETGNSTNPNRLDSKFHNDPIYNRLRSITTDGTAFTTHKFIKDFSGVNGELPTGKYYYKVGREFNWSETRSFTFKSQELLNSEGVNYLHISDQQGFNGEEYITHELSADFIKQDVDTKFDFIINTGDATQNGNRINEWLDYFKKGDNLFKDTCQMYTVGNNDLCPMDVFQLGEGDESSKLNPINILYFFTYEHPNGLPKSAAGVYVPCVYDFIIGDSYFLCMNSEIPENARLQYFKDVEGVNVYNEIKTWCTAQLAHIPANVKWKVSYCHESPFTIITGDLILSAVKMVDGQPVIQPAVQRAGSRINTQGNYWYSQFLQDNGFKVCLCGHKHTYANSRYIYEDPTATMQPYVYEPLLEEATWYKNLVNTPLIGPRVQSLCKLTNDKNKNYVRYVMCQATGYKLSSNKELPAPGIPWIMDYFPATLDKIVISDGAEKINKPAVNKQQMFPSYMLWNIGSGTEAENPAETVTNRERIIAKPFRIQAKSALTTWPAKYKFNTTVEDLKKVPGNGLMDGYNERNAYYVIIEKTL